VYVASLLLLFSKNDFQKHIQTLQKLRVSTGEMYPMTYVEWTEDHFAVV